MPVLRGQRGVAIASDAIAALGHTVLATEVTILAGGARTRIDILIQRTDGSIVFIEVKTGSGTLTRNQEAAFPIIRQSGGEVRTSKLADPLSGGIPKGALIAPTEVWVLRYGVMDP